MEAMLLLEKGHPYSLRPEDPKRKLLDEVGRLCREMGLSPIVIGGLAVSHHGYLRTTKDADILASKKDGMALIRRLRSELGWKRYGEGFMNTILEVGLDICVQGQRASPRGEEVFPDPAEFETVAAEPLPVVSLPDLVALKVMSGRARDEGDVVEIFKVHRKRMDSVCASAARRLKTPAAKALLKSLLGRAKEELRR
jgi:hypothetical protein